MFCPACGKEQPDDAPFCTFCGTRLCNEEDTDAELSQKQESSTLEPAVNDAPEKAAKKPERRGKSFKFWAIGIIIAILAIGIIAWLVISAIPPALDEEIILSDAETDALGANVGVSSVWVDNDEFILVSKSIDSVEESNVQDKHYKTAHITVVFENTPFRVTSQYEKVYLLQDKRWVLDDSLQLTQNVEPLSGVSDAKVVERVSSFMKQVDENPPKDANGDKQYLSKVYTEGVKFEVAENNTSASGGEVKINLSSQLGVASYAGVLSVNFNWTGGDWEVGSCSVDAGAYIPNYSAMVGTWTGEFQEANSKCYAGRNAPPVLTIKSVDEVGKTATADISFLVHGHKRLSNVSESTDGDQAVTLTDIIIAIEDGTGYYKIQSGEVSDDLTYRIDMKILDNGSLSMNILSKPGWLEYKDTFSMSRSSDATETSDTGSSSGSA